MNIRFIYLFATILSFIMVGCSSDSEKSEWDVPFNPSQPIVVNDIGPKEGGLGTRVVVSGSNFGNDKNKIKLCFNNKEALVLKVQNNAIYAMVPKQPGDSSLIKVMVEQGIKPDSTKIYKEGVLQNKRFIYHVKASVTTVAGQFGVEYEPVDGPLLKCAFGRPVMLDINSKGIMIVSDDKEGTIRLVSLTDEKVSTIGYINEPWSVSFNPQGDKCYVLPRRASQRPILCIEFSEKTNYQEGINIYDQQEDDGDYIMGDVDTYGITSDEKYIFVLSSYGDKLVRINQETKKVELIGKDLGMDSWTHMVYSPKDKCIYLTSEDLGRIYRFDPYHTPAGNTKPWITINDIVWYAGNGAKGSPKEGNQRNAQFGSIEGCGSDDLGNTYYSDYQNHVIWKMDDEGNMTILGGVPGTSGYKDGSPKESMFYRPYSVASTPDGVVYVADTFNRLIRCINIQ